MKRISIIILAALSLTAGPAMAEVTIDGFLQTLYGGRIDESNPTATEQTASETRMQLRAEHYGDGVEFFGRLDFVYDGADSSRYDWELREGYMKFRLGRRFDFKVGRQILTWGTGDLIFINDVFAKDYRSFFIGRDDQYLKAPQNAIRADFYSGLGALSLVWTPRFEPNRLPTGRRLSYFNGVEIVGEGSFFNPPTPEAKFENSELAMRLNRRIGSFATSLYFYKGFYKNPLGVVMVDETMMPVYPKLNVYGASIRGPIAGGIIWIEGGYFDSREDLNGDDPMMPNSSLTGLAGFERQIATNLTANLQWQVDMISDWDTYKAQREAAGSFVRDEIRHLLTSRVTRLMYDELVNLSLFVFYSPTDEDGYFRGSVSYKYTDELELALGVNIFEGKNQATEFGQFEKNDNVYLKLTYGF